MCQSLLQSAYASVLIVAHMHTGVIRCMLILCPLFIVNSVNSLQYASLVGCRFMDATGNGWVSDAIRCWEYCMSKDTPVLSNSWGGVDYSQALQV